MKHMNKNKDFDIKKINSIIATEMLLSNYGIDILEHSEQELDTLIELIEIVKPSLTSLKVKARINNDFND